MGILTQSKMFEPLKCLFGHVWIDTNAPIQIFVLYKMSRVRCYNKLPALYRYQIFYLLGYTNMMSEEDEISLENSPTWL